MHPCRHCGATLDAVFCDLGMQPLANRLLTAEEIDGPQTYYPLRPMVCRDCLLVQLPEIATPSMLFSDYAYFSGQSQEWVRHCARYAQTVRKRFGKGRAVELASNDGTLVEALTGAGFDALGVEPAENVADYAKQHGIPTWVAFFGRQAASDIGEGSADLVVANNVLAHVPDLDDFVGGIEMLLAPDGVVTVEFPWLKMLVEQRQWDTIYHEHYSYFTLWTAMAVLDRAGLRVFDVELLSTHGGSLRVFACRRAAPHATEASVPHLTRIEETAGFHSLARYEDFQAVPARERRAVWQRLTAKPFLTCAYGAAAKGVTFLNYCQIGTETVRFIVDSTPAKQGMFTPGGRIPVVAPETLQAYRPQRIVILPWNWEFEIREKIMRDCDWYPEMLARPFA